VEIRAMPVEIQNRIAHQLTRTVKGHVAAPLHLEHFNALPFQLGHRDREAVGAAPAADRDYRVVLDKEQ
jgi:hypothetical protein